MGGWLTTVTREASLAGCTHLVEEEEEEEEEGESWSPCVAGRWSLSFPPTTHPPTHPNP